MRDLSRVAVSGATSFLGSAVVRKLLEQGCEVYGIVRPDSLSRGALPQHPRFHEVSCDFSDAEEWAREIGEADTFFHFAWGGPGIQGRSDAMVQKLSADNTLRSLPYAAQLGVRRFFLSGSQAEYGPVSGIISEETPCRPVLEYGKNKLRVCQSAPGITHELGMEYVHARYFSVYGPHDHPYALIPSCIRTFLNGETMELSECKNQWNFLHVEDAAEAALLLAQCELSETSSIVNVASDDTRVLRAYVEEIHQLCGGCGVCAFGARRVSETPVDNRPDITKVQSMTGWMPRISFRDGISALIREERRRSVQERNPVWKV